MLNAFSRLEAALGRQKTDRLCRARIAVFGLGGAGSFVAESLARCGVGSLTLVDSGIISEEDISSHLYALCSTVGQSRARIAKERIRGIDEAILVHTYETRYAGETEGLFDFSGFDYVVDTLDEIGAKALLAARSKREGIPVISCAILDNLIDPSKLTITDLSRTGAWPAMKRLRNEFRNQGIRSLCVLASRESLRPPGQETYGPKGAICMVEGMAGLMIASEVVKNLTEDKPARRKNPLHFGEIHKRQEK